MIRCTLGARERRRRARALLTLREAVGDALEFRVVHRDGDALHVEVCGRMVPRAVVRSWERHGFVERCGKTYAVREARA